MPTYKTRNFDLRRLLTFDEYEGITSALRDAQHAGKATEEQIDRLVDRLMDLTIGGAES